jgi:SsrA-binding protein
MVQKSDPNSKLIAENRRARFDYHIESDLEAGIVLQGSEVKSLRQGGANIGESYASVEGGELWLINGYIAPYLQAKTWGHEERRRRKLLVSKKELSRLWSATAREGMTIVPIRMYFNDRGVVKLKLGHRQGQETGRQARDQCKARLGPAEGPAAEAGRLTPRPVFTNRTIPLPQGEHSAILPLPGPLATWLSVRVGNSRNTGGTGKGLSWTSHLSSSSWSRVRSAAMRLARR